MKFKKFEDLDMLEKEGKGLSWRFDKDENYIKKALSFNIRVTFPSGVYKFKTFREAEAWEREWWIKNGSAKRAG
jgi:hypothetical protein